MNIHELHHEVVQRQPEDREMFVHDGHIHVFRQNTNQWEDLGEGSEEGTVPEVGSLQFELQQGIVAEGSPAFVLRLLLRAFLNVRPTMANDFAETCFNIFRECGWTGPIESENQAVPGYMTVEHGDVETVHKLDDLRNVMAQLQDPQLNGWLQTERDNVVRFTNITQATQISVVREEKDEGDRQAVAPVQGEDQSDPGEAAEN